MLVTVERMNNSKNEVTVTTSLDIAETFGKRHSDVLRNIRELDCSEQFNERNFALVNYTDIKGEKRPMYYVTRDGFTFLVMGYTGEKAARFKEAYIKQFNAMEKQLTARLCEREKGIAVRNSLTKALQISQENERMHGHAYSTYTNCIYKVIFGMNAKQLKNARGLTDKEQIRDYLSPEELAAVEGMERLVSGLVDCGFSYNEVKEFIRTVNTRKTLE